MICWKDHFRCVYSFTHQFLQERLEACLHPLSDPSIVQDLKSRRKLKISEDQYKAGPEGLKYA